MPIPASGHGANTLSSSGQRSGTTNSNDQACSSKPEDQSCLCGKPIQMQDHPRLLPLIRKPPLSQERLRRHRHIRHSRHQRRCRSTYVDKFTVAKIPRCHKRVQEATHPTRSSPSLSPLPRICAPSPNTTFSLVQFLNYLVNNKTFVPIF